MQQKYASVKRVRFWASTCREGGTNMIDKSWHWRTRGLQFFTCRDHYPPRLRWDFGREGLFGFDFCAFGRRYQVWSWRKEPKPSWAYTETTRPEPAP